MRPENITIDSGGNIRIIDFDQSRLDPVPAKKTQELEIMGEVTTGVAWYTGPAQTNYVVLLVGFFHEQS